MKARTEITQVKIPSVDGIVKGKPRSGRVWKEGNKRFSNLTIQTSNRTSWQKKMDLKREKKLACEQEKQVLEANKQKKIVNLFDFFSLFNFFFFFVVLMYFFNVGCLRKAEIE